LLSLAVITSDICRGSFKFGLRNAVFQVRALYLTHSEDHRPLRFAPYRDLLELRNKICTVVKVVSKPEKSNPIVVN